MSAPAMLARGLAVKLLRITATVILVGLVAAGAGRWLIDLCGSGPIEWLALGILLVSPAAAALLFCLPRLAMLRYIDNVVVACLTSPIAFTAAVETYDASCGAESIPAVWLISGLILAVIGAVLGAAALYIWLRTRQEKPSLGTQSRA